MNETEGYPPFSVVFNMDETAFDDSSWDAMEIWQASLWESKTFEYLHRFMVKYAHQPLSVKFHGKRFFHFLTNSNSSRISQTSLHKCLVRSHNK